MKYELCYLVGESKEQDLARIKEEISNIVSKEGGKWFELQVEEKRKMAYKVGKEVRGIYVAQQFEISREEAEDGSEERKNVLDSITRKLNLYQDILRFIIVKAEDLPELKVRPAVVKVAAGEGRNYKKPIYVKKSEPVRERPVIEKTAETKVEEKKFEETVSKEEKTTEASAPEKTPEEKNKSIDEKIDEILNI